MTLFFVKLTVIEDEEAKEWVTTNCCIVQSTNFQTGRESKNAQDGDFS